MDRTAFLDQLHAQFAAPRPAVIELIQRVCKDRVEAVERLIHGDENEVHRATLSGGSTVYLRIGKPDSPAIRLYREAWAMEHARQAGVPVPDVLTVERIASHKGERHAMLVAAADGQQLRGRLPAMSPGQRASVMRELGSVLATLHTVPMPGRGIPDDTGSWPDQTQHLRRHLENVLAACDRLGAAGLTDTEIQQARDLVQQASQDADGRQKPVLCHGDLSPDHVFVDEELRVRALIDWGLWSAGTAVDGLADVAMRNTAADFDAVLKGHSLDAATDPALRRGISRALMIGAIGTLSWLITSGQTGDLDTYVASLRRALTDLTAA